MSETAVQFLPREIPKTNSSLASHQHLTTDSNAETPHKDNALSDVDDNGMGNLTADRSSHAFQLPRAGKGACMNFLCRRVHVQGHW